MDSGHHESIFYEINGWILKFRLVLVLSWIVVESWQDKLSNLEHLYEGIWRIICVV